VCVCVCVCMYGLVRAYDDFYACSKTIEMYWDRRKAAAVHEIYFAKLSASIHRRAAQNLV
jgi:hypothetical protein